MAGRAFWIGVLFLTSPRLRGEVEIREANFG